MKQNNIAFGIPIHHSFLINDSIEIVDSVDSSDDSIPPSDNNASSEQNLSSDSGKTSKIDLIQADSFAINEVLAPNARIFYSDVIFRHDSSYMYSDSVYFYEHTNSLEAFSNVRMEQGDTLFIYGNYLHYDGNTRIAHLRENVRMENNQVTLFSDSLNYERDTDIGYYFEGGLIVDEENELSSFYGQYSPSTKLAIFNDSVQLYNSDFVLTTDTLHYYTDSKIATILGPSIVESDSGKVYTSRGWFDTEKNTSLLLDRSRIVSGDKELIGDSILYDQENGFAEVFGNMFMQDTAQCLILEGHYGFYNEKIEYAFATDSARFLEYGQSDTLYVHADTFQLVTVDSTYREMNAYYGVRFYRTDMQGVCDSMQFNTADSVLYMFNNPVLWNKEYQMFGDTIEIYMQDSTIDYAHVKQFAFSIQEVDTSYYNQLKGSSLKAYFEEGAVRLVDVEGNAESIFYPIENDGAMIGLNQTKSGFLSIWIQDNKLEKLKLWPESEGLLTPIPDLRPEQKTLKDFQWFDYLRPKDKDDIYRAVKKNAEQETPRQSNKFVH